MPEKTAQPASTVIKLIFFPSIFYIYKSLCLLKRFIEVKCLRIIVFLCMHSIQQISKNGSGPFLTLILDQKLKLN